MEEKAGLTRAIKVEAKRLGFTLVGITGPNRPPHFPAFERWLEAGKQGKMAYLATERSRTRRSDPLEILPDCRSILVLGIPYWTQSEAERHGPYTGRVASYAWGDDYHDVLPRRLQALTEFLETELGRPVANRWYTDTGPILERDIAQQAGLGWAGKNTCLIHPQKGSYFLLAEILLDVELELDPPFASDHCGTCTRCLDACPTGCILPDRSIDARHCISYLTIELKEAIPARLRPQIQDWVFGCDVCQQVCPWNERFATASGEPAFASRPDTPHPDLIQDLKVLTPEAFNRRFKGSPVKRAKRRGYLRNVSVALGNLACGSGDPEAVAALEAALQDSEPLVRAHAAWALGQVGGDAARRVLQAAALKEDQPPVQAEICAALF